MNEHFNCISSSRSRSFKRFQCVFQFIVVRYQWFHIYFSGCDHIQSKRITATTTEFIAKFAFHVIYLFTRWHIGTLLWCPLLLLKRWPKAASFLIYPFQLERLLHPTEWPVIKWIKGNKFNMRAVLEIHLHRSSHTDFSSTTIQTNIRLLTKPINNFLYQRYVGIVFLYKYSVIGTQFLCNVESVLNNICRK